MDNVKNKIFNIVSQGTLGELEHALKAGVDPNERNGFGLTAIFLAVSIGRTRMIRMLAKFGADLTLQNNAGMSPRDIAYFNRNTVAVDEIDRIMRNAENNKKEN